MNNLLTIPKMIAGAVAALVFLVVVLSTYFTIDQGERGVILHNGAVVGEAEPGLHFKMPLITTVVKISVQVQKIGFDVHDKDNDFSMKSYSRDQQPATIALAINYHVINVVGVYSSYGTLDNLESTFIDPKINEQVKNVFGQFNAVEAIQDRAKLNNQVMAAVIAATKSPLVVIDSVQIENIDFSDKYEKAVEDRMEAQVRQQQAEASKAKRIIDADAAAYEVKAQADAKAHQITVQGTAEATTIKLRGDALRENPGLPMLVTAEKWDGHLPTTMPPGGAVPFLNLK